MLKQLTELTGLQETEVSFDRMDFPESPESHIYIQDRNSGLRIDIRTERKTRKTFYELEWPSILNDGVFVAYEHRQLSEAMRVFAFALRMLNDLRQAVYSVV